MLKPIHSVWTEQILVDILTDATCEISVLAELELKFKLGHDRAPTSRPTAPESDN